MISTEIMKKVKEIEVKVVKAEANKEVQETYLLTKYNIAGIGEAEKRIDDIKKELEAITLRKQELEVSLAGLTDWTKL